MEYIDNRDLREWVKKSLRKTLFQKAHELAVQTGCEILLRVQDVSVPESLGTQYYGTQSVQKMYDNNKLQKRPGEILVCGESGLPVKRKVDRGIQMTDGTSETSAPSEDERNENNELMQDPFVQDSGISTDVDMPNLGNTEYTGTNGDQFENHQQKDDKIDLTQDSDSDDSIVEVGEVKEEPGAPRQLFKQEQAFAGQTRMYTHPTPYQCAVCQKAFTNVEMLENHNKLEHAGSGGDGVAAMVTGSNVQQQQEAMMSYKLEPNSYTCIRCQSTFNDSSLLHNHMTQCHMGNAPTSSFGSPTHLGPQFSNTTTQIRPQFSTANSPVQPGHGIPAAAGSPHSLPQITSVTSLKLMPGAMMSSAQSSQMPGRMNMSSAPSSPMVSSSSPSSYHSPLATRSLPSSSPVASRNLSSSSPGASPRGRKRPRAGCALGQNATMSAVLQTMGPVSTHACCATNWKCLRMLSIKQFVAACQELQNCRLGLLISVGAMHVFIKAQPGQAEDGLNENSDLCTQEYYSMRYDMQSPKVVSQSLREKLIAMGMIAPEQFEQN